MYWLNDNLFGNQSAQITFNNNKFTNVCAEMDLAYHETYIYMYLSVKYKIEGKTCRAIFSVLRLAWQMTLPTIERFHIAC